MLVTTGISFCHTLARHFILIFYTLSTTHVIRCCHSHFTDKKIEACVNHLKNVLSDINLEFTSLSKYSSSEISEKTHIRKKLCMDLKMFFIKINLSFNSAFHKLSRYLHTTPCCQIKQNEMNSSEAELLKP